MTASHALPLSAISPPLANLVTHHGWVLIQSHGQLGYLVTAAIEKSGIRFTYTASKGEVDYGVQLASPVHPCLGWELDPRPSLADMLAPVAVDADFARTAQLVNDQLPLIRRYLNDRTVWDAQVKAAIARLRNRHATWCDGSPALRELAAALQKRHPWLASDCSPTPVQLRARALAQLSPRSAARAIAFGAIGIALLIKCFTR